MRLEALEKESTVQSPGTTVQKDTETLLYTGDVAPGQKKITLRKALSAQETVPRGGKSRTGRNIYNFKKFFIMKFVKFSQLLFPQTGRLKSL